MSPSNAREEIRRARARAALTAVFSTASSAQLFFWSFAFGSSLGPVPLRPFELASGASFALGLGLIFSWPFVRRRIEAGAQLVANVREDGRRHRLAIFARYLALDKEIVPRGEIEGVALQDERLCVTYRPEGAAAGDTITMRLAGPLPTLERALGLLTSASAQVAAGAP